jgi:LysR family transcriptional regulator, nitrogen assimilation regulatory protein
VSLDRKMLDLRLLRDFVAIAEEGSLSRAAQRLNIAQPALGRRLQTLEAEFGFRLFDRGSRGVSPTQVGRLLLGEARDLLERADALWSRLQSVREAPRGDVRVGLTPAINNVIGEAFLDYCRQELPLVRISIVEAFTSQLMEMMRAERIVLALAYDVVAGEPGVRTKTIAKEYLYYLLPALDKTTLDPKVTQTVPLCQALSSRLVMPVLPNEGLHQILKRAAAQVGRTLDVEFEVQSVPAVRRLLARGDLATFFPYGALLDDVNEGRMQAYRVVEPAILRRLCLARPDRRYPDSAEAIVAALMERTVSKIRRERFPAWLPSEFTDPDAITT